MSAEIPEGILVSNPGNSVLMPPRFCIIRNSRESVGAPVFSRDAIKAAYPRPRWYVIRFSPVACSKNDAGDRPTSL